MRADAGVHRTDHLWRQRWALTLGVESKQTGVSVARRVPKPGYLCLSLEGAALKSNLIEL